ncbi:MAG: cytochrome c [Pirellulaceae bacterium]|nr:cytochrome c [Pirellulaceae bacterium]
MRLSLVWLIVVALLGCDAPVEHFEPNEVYALTLAKTRDVETISATDDVARVVESLFGTPEHPKWPAEWIDDSTAKSLIQVEHIEQAAGPVYSDRDGTNFGLYNKHCVTCHAVNGSGAGPASVFQNPYPRDFRAGIFKWKSTERNAKPTRDDLAGLLHRGVPGTGMPSFALIQETDANALIDYLIYLSVRGETERKLLALAVDELGYDDAAGPPEEQFDIAEPTADNPIHHAVNSVLQSWLDAETRVVAVPEPIDRNRSSIDRGRDLFHGQIANCAGCHGPGGNGSVPTLDYDDWSKEYSSRIGLTPSDRDAMKPFRDAGALLPRQIRPRKLDEGVFRGGGQGATLYRQISQGIAGTPMPGVKITDAPSPTGLTADQVWDLVHYVESLGNHD